MLFALLASPAVILIAMLFGGRTLPDRWRVLVHLVGIALLGALVLTIGQGLAYGRFVLDDLARSYVALLALAALFYERWRDRAGQPLPVRVRKVAATVLAVAALAAFALPSLNWRVMGSSALWDTYHYYIGTKYFPELRYDSLYRCTLVAQSELVEVRDGEGVVHNLAVELAEPGRTYRELIPGHPVGLVSDALAHGAECRSRFTSERWQSFRDDIRIFRLEADRVTWFHMHHDFGFNPPPVWMLLGKPLIDHTPLSRSSLRALAMIDVVLFAAMFAAMRWGFGWRVASVGAVLYGTSALNTFLWPGISILRNDWLFLLVLAACLARRRWFLLAGAAFAWSGLLRIFPLVIGLGLAAHAAAHFVRVHRLSRAHFRFAAGAVAMGAFLLPASIAVTGLAAYPEFVNNTRMLHQVPHPIHIGWPALVTPALGDGPESKRLKYLYDPKLTYFYEPARSDLFGLWQQARRERWEKVRWIAIPVAGVFLAWFCWVAARQRRIWTAFSMGPLAIVLASQVFAYYYAFLILLAPLSRLRPRMEFWLIGFAVASQGVTAFMFYRDDRFAALNVLTLVLAIGVALEFTRESRVRRSKIPAPSLRQSSDQTFGLPTSAMLPSRSMAA